MFSLTSKWRTQGHAAWIHLQRCDRLYRRGYAQQPVSRTPQSSSQQSTSKPSPTSQVKNRTLDGNAAQRVFHNKNAAAETQGIDALLPAMMAMKGTDLWAQKFPLLGTSGSSSLILILSIYSHHEDLRIPRRYGDALKDSAGIFGVPGSLWQTLSENGRNRWQNILRYDLTDLLSIWLF